MVSSRLPTPVLARNSRFRLQDTALSSTIRPPVCTILIGHSMGGIVAAETLFSILSDGLVVGTHQENFPYVQGILAFDTPYLGICPHVIAHGVEKHLKTASSAYSIFSEVVLGCDASPKSPTNTTHGTLHKPIKSVWTWVKYVLFTVAGVLACGATLYARRDRVSENRTWIVSHLEFVGCLMRGEDLKKRLDEIMRIREEKHVGFSNLVTVLASTGSMLKTSPEKEKTFCTLPKEDEAKGYFEKVMNAKASDEITAHLTIFKPGDNPGYYDMGYRARDLIVQWVGRA